MFDPATNRAKAVRVREILAGDQLAFEGVDFWNPKTLAQLADEQGTGPITNPGVLALDNVSDAEWEAFYEAIGVVR